MNMFSIELALIALLPGIVLCGYVFYKDRIEKEPAGLLTILFASGFLAYLPAAFLQSAFFGLIDKTFADKVSFSTIGTATWSSDSAYILHLLLCSFIGHALIQTVIKWLVLVFITRKNKNFNYLFDGVIYSVFVSIGFALAENIHFLSENSIEFLLPKLLTSVPCHLFIAILMGYYYTMWHVRYSANVVESHMIKNKTITADKVKTSAPWFTASLLVPVMIHGLFFTASSARNDILTLAFYFVVFFLYGISFIIVNDIASKDKRTVAYLFRLISKGHPELSKDDIALAAEQCMITVTKESKENNK